MSLPENLKIYFWDVDFGLLNLEDNRIFIAERILDKGDEEAVSWLRKQYSDKELQSVVTASKKLTDKSRNYWKLVLHLWSTATQSVNKQEKIWKY